MINSIRIKNFRSIQQADIKLMPLTVIVGANSTGKSNLIKALDFISDIPRFGLREALYKRGGILEVLPKAITGTQNEEIRLCIDLSLDPPENWKKEFGNLPVYYDIVFYRTKKNALKIKNESLKVHSILLLAYVLENFDGLEADKIEIEPSLLLELQSSSIEVTRLVSGKFKYEKNFTMNPLNKQLFISWLGMDSFFDKPESNTITSKNLTELFKTMLSRARLGQEDKTLPIISIDRAVFGFSPQLRKLVSEIQSIARYDLLVNELRQEQPISDSIKVSQTGDNIPSIVKKFIKEKEKIDSWNRILRTMSNISPFFSSVNYKSLRAGKEYLVFKEIFDGRPIESWEASDGTLRALAILLSLESQNEGSTILIEEPEHGLHPWAVKDLMLHIKEVIDLKNLQVIITTHSQQVLESIEKEELLIAERSETGTSFSTIEDVMPGSEISMGEIGELWTRGLLKGVPSNF